LLNNAGWQKDAKANQQSEAISWTSGLQLVGGEEQRLRISAESLTPDPLKIDASVQEGVIS